MYNGVGLTSVRGSATNGYVQRNLAHQKPKTKIDYNKEMEKAMAKPSLGRLALGRARARARRAGERPPRRGIPRHACARVRTGAGGACASGGCLPRGTLCGLRVACPDAARPMCSKQAAESRHP